jgi:hypothetical protein
MPDIEFKDLSRSIGTELFADTESFLEDLTDDATNILGGISEHTAISTTIRATSVVRPEDAMMTTVYFLPEHYPTPPVIATAFLPPTKPPYHRPKHHKFMFGAAD